jgi:galactosyl transferase GMA12/MNN10 family
MSRDRSPPSRRSDLAVITFNDLPAINHTFKYEVLGPLAIENRRRYCERHGYDFISDVPIARDRPACWAKIPALLDALTTHEWVLWADSDTLIFEGDLSFDVFCDPHYDMVVQSHAEFFRFIGVPVEEGLARMPINTGVFLMRRSDWSRDFLLRAYEQTDYVSQGELWNGVGEQEAMIALLKRSLADLRRIKYVQGLQNHAQFYRSGDRFVHFYGNHARHRIPLAECAEVFARWRNAVLHSTPLPSDLARFHWCCIQNKSEDASVVRGDLSHYLYRPEDILPAERNAIRQGGKHAEHTGSPAAEAGFRSGGAEHLR